MKRLIKYSVIFGILLSIIYGILWYFVMNGIVTTLNAEYSKKDLRPFKDERVVRFDHASISGFPNKFSFKINGLQETGELSQVECKSPIEIGYDLRKQKLFASYKGDIISRYKPLQSGFGSKIVAESYLLTMDLPLNFQISKILFINLPFNRQFNGQFDKFQLINFANTITLKSGKTQILDLIDQKINYDQEFESLSITMISPKQYSDIKSFTESIPSKFTIDYIAKINKADYFKRVSPASVVFGVSWPFVFNGEVKITGKTNGQELAKLDQDLELDIVYSNKSEINDSSLKAKYISKSLPNNANIQLEVDSSINIKEGFFSDILGFLKIITSNNAFAAHGKYTIDEINYITNNQHVFNFKELENRKYLFAVDFKLTGIDKNYNMVIDKFTIHSGKTGISLTNESNVSGLFNLKTKGNLLLNNFPKITDIITHNMYNSGQYKFLTPEVRETYIDVMKYFLKSISDYPKSLSDDVSFEYDIDMKQLADGKIGSASIENLKKLYSLALLQKISEKAGNSQDMLDKLREILPELDNNPEKLGDLLNK